MTFAGDRVEHPTAVAAYVGRTVMDVEVVAAASRQDRPCFGWGSGAGRGRWSQEGKAGRADSFAKDRLRSWANYGCVGTGRVAFLGLSMA